MLEVTFLKKGTSNNIVARGRSGYYLNEELIFPFNRVGVFTKRAILRIGMLLRNSQVVKEVRNQVLNIVTSVTDEPKTFEITKEKELFMSIMFAKTEVERATLLINSFARNDEQAHSIISK